MTPREILERSLEEDHFSSHTHELNVFAERAAGVHAGDYCIPERYNLDRCALLMVNPHRLFFYWEISSDTKESLSIMEEGLFRVCLMRGETRVACADVRGDIGSYYFSVSDSYPVMHAVLIWIDGDGRERIVLRSESVGFPDSQYARGDFWSDRYGAPLLKASIAHDLGGSSGGLGSSAGLHVQGEER